MKKFKTESSSMYPYFFSLFLNEFLLWISFYLLALPK